MADIIQFDAKPKNEDLIFRCGCGCLSFSLRADMRAECLSCGEVAADETGSWRVELPDVPEQVDEVSEGDTRVTVVGSDELAIRRVLSKVNAQDTCFVAVAQMTGTVTVYGARIETADQADWVDARLSDIRSQLIPSDT